MKKTARHKIKQPQFELTKALHSACHPAMEHLRVDGEMGRPETHVEWELG